MMMADTASGLRSFALETRFEILRLLRRPAFLVPLFAFPLAFYYFFGIAMGSQHVNGYDLTTYLLASYGAFGVIGSALFGFGIGLALERGNGWLVLRRASPMRLPAYLIAKMIAALVFALAISIAIEILGATAGGVHLAPHTWAALLATLVAGAIPFCALGFAIGMLAPASAAPAIVNLVYLPLSFMGGLWVPASLLPPTFARIAPWTPTYHLGKLALAALNMGSASVADVGALAAWAIVFLGLAAFGWRRDESRAMSNTEARPRRGLRVLPPGEGYMPYVWLVYVACTFIYPVVYGSVALFVVTAVAATAFLVLYFWGHWVGGRFALVILIAIALIGAIASPFNALASTYFVYASSFAPQVGSIRLAWQIVGALIVAIAIEALVLHLGINFWACGGVFTAIVGASVIRGAEIARANAELRAAREDVERLAKLAERERIARDLHDVLGHTLSVIVLKSELAAKIAESDPIRAANEIRDVERTARESLGELRAALTGYRAAGVASEIESARNVLRVAGVRFDCDVASDVRLEPRIENVVALAIREAVTNVVRHAHATTCRLRLIREHETCRFTISDDGCGTSGEEGLGLRGMRERIEALGGSFTRSGGAGTELVLVVPGAPR